MHGVTLRTALEDVTVIGRSRSSRSAGRCSPAQRPTGARPSSLATRHRSRSGERDRRRGVGGVGRDGRAARHRARFRRRAGPGRAGLALVDWRAPVDGAARARAAGAGVKASAINVHQTGLSGRRPARCRGTRRSGRCACARCSPITTWSSCPGFLARDGGDAHRLAWTRRLRPHRGSAGGRPWRGPLRAAQRRPGLLHRGSEARSDARPIPLLSLRACARDGG